MLMLMLFMGSPGTRIHPLGQAGIAAVAEGTDQDVSAVLVRLVLEAEFMGFLALVVCHVSTGFGRDDGGAVGFGFVDACVAEAGDGGWVFVCGGGDGGRREVLSGREISGVGAGWSGFKLLKHLEVEGSESDEVAGWKTSLVAEMAAIG
jgi:hypothetical protein